MVKSTNRKPHHYFISLCYHPQQGYRECVEQERHALDRNFHASAFKNVKFYPADYFLKNIFKIGKKFWKLKRVSVLD